MLGYFGLCLGLLGNFETLRDVLGEFRVVLDNIGEKPGNLWTSWEYWELICDILAWLGIFCNV